MWQRDEFLARARVADREREARASARIRGLLEGERLPVRATSIGASMRRSIANVFAASGRAAMWLARQIDNGVEVEASRAAR